MAIQNESLFDHALISMLPEPQRRRMLGQVRKGTHDECKTHFLVLSERCQVVTVWDSYWSATYPSNEAAQKAAKWWEEHGEVLDAKGVPIKRRKS